MIGIKTILHRLQDVKLLDIVSGIQFLFAIPCASIFKRKHKNLWLICEDEYEARDNGYFFYRYLVKNHPEQEAVYAINIKSPDYKKVKSLGGTVIQYGSFKHWVYYLAASKNISSQKGGKPNAAVCYFLEVGGLLKNTRIFLQHGITKDDAKWLYYPVTRFSMFVCGAKPEYEFIKERFQYPEGAVRYLGFARFDNLHKDITDKKLVLIMPTWRNWFVLRSKNVDGRLPSVRESQFCRAWDDFLNDDTFREILRKNDLHAIFYPHRNMQPFLDEFSVNDERIVIASQRDYDVQKLLRHAAVLITDFSSVFFDMLYMQKPVVFYQFDEEEYRAKQYQQGYFDYTDNPFSIRETTLEGAIRAFRRTVEQGFKVDEKYLDGHKKYFSLYDRKNCERTYEAICRLNRLQGT